MPRRWACRWGGSSNGKSGCKRQTRRIPRCCTVARGHVSIRPSASVNRWLSASCSCVTLRQRVCGGRRGPRPSCTTCPAIPTCKQSGCHAPAGRSTASCSKPDASPTGCPMCKRSLHARRRCAAGNWISRMPPPCTLTRTVSDSTWYQRTFQEECLAVERPGTLEQVREATTQFQQHYNWSRPHQGLSCGNRPPRVVFPTLPELPAVPDLVDPDRWLRVTDGLHLVRLVRRDGTVRVDLKSYYVG